MIDFQINFVLQELRNIDKSKVIVKVDGRGGSGKTTIAKKISEALITSIYINLDNYVLNGVDLFDQKNIDNGFNFDFQNTTYNEALIKGIIQSTSFKYIIIEGCFSFKNTSIILEDYKIWIEVSKEVARQRLNNREKSDPGRKHLSFEIIELASERWQKSEDDYLMQFKPQEKANAVIKN